MSGKTGRGSWKLIAIITVIVLCMSGGGLWLQLRRSANSRRDQVKSLESVLLSSARKRAVDHVNSAWAVVSGSKACVASGQRVADDLDATFRRKETDHVKKYSVNYLDLQALDPDRYFEVDSRQKSAERNVEAILESNRGRMETELKNLKGRIVDDNPLRLTPWGKHDRSTVRGERDYQEEQILLPAIHREEEERFRATVDRLYHERSPSIICRWHKSTLDEVLRAVDGLEAELREIPLP